MLQIINAQCKSDLTHAVLQEKGSKLEKCVLSGKSFFAVNSSAINCDFYVSKCIKLSGDVSTVNLRIGSKLLSFAKTAELSQGLIKTSVSST